MKKGKRLVLCLLLLAGLVNISRAVKAMAEEINATNPNVKMEKITSKLSLKGRLAAGYYWSGESGPYSPGSAEIPEAKIQFCFEPDDINKIVLRFDLNNAAANGLDYFYIDTKLESVFNLPFGLGSRLGRFKVDFGEETWGNNPVESVLASASAADVKGSDEGLQLKGGLGQTQSIEYVIAVSNGNSGKGADNAAAKALNGKVVFRLIDPLYISTNYYRSGSLGLGKAEISVGGLVTPPAGAMNWSREMWEVDCRYDWGKGKVLTPPAFCNSKAFIRLAYGQFADYADLVSGRKGVYGFVEGTYNITDRIYQSARASMIELYKHAAAVFNGIALNQYDRYSFGLGYRVSANTIFKLGYDINKEYGQGVADTNNDQFSVVLASQF